MTPREQIVALLTVDTLPTDERKVFEFILETNGEGELEGLMFEDAESHLRGRFEWYFTPDGERRRKSA